MKQIIVSVAWKYSAFDGTMNNELDYGTFRVIEHSFYDFVDMVQSCLDIAIKEWVEKKNECPDWYKNKDYEFVYKFQDIVTILKAYTSYVSLAAISRVTGINQTLLSHYANGLKQPRRGQLERIISGLHRIGEELKGVSYESK